MTPRERPIPRWRIAAAATAVLLAILAMGAGIEVLRHGEEPGDSFAVDEDTGDPRRPLECPEPVPREGLEREEEVAPQLEAPLPLGSGDLLGCPQAYDGRRVVYRGEAVGQVIGRGDRVWVQVNDDVYAGEVGPLPVHRFYRGGNSGVGVSVERAQADRLTWRGGPTAHGDQVEVQGVFHRVHPGTGEMAVIEAERLVILAEGRALRREARTDRAVAAYVLSAVAVGMIVLQRRRTRI